MLGHALAMRGDGLRHLVKLYHEHGPIFDIKAAHRGFTVLAGADANRLLMKQGDEYLSSHLLFGGVAREMGSDYLLVALDGPSHMHLRKQMRRGFSMAAAKPYVSRFIDIVDELTRDWRPGQLIPAFPFMQRLVTEQLSEFLIGRRAAEMFDNLLIYFNTLMNVEVLRIWPRFMLRRPKYRHAKARCLALGEEILAERDASGPNDPPDLVDDLMKMIRADGTALSQQSKIGSVVGNYFAGMDTVASTLAFLMHSTIHDRKVHEAVRADADRALNLGDRLFDELGSLEDLRACVLETLRLWPPVPYVPRVVTEPFAFAGHRLDVGTEVMMAQCATHFLEEYFPDPFRFELARHKAPRFEAQQKMAFVPFSLGAHTCLGSGLAEVQIMVTLATLLNRFDLELAVPNQPISVFSTPLPNPGKKFMFRVRGRR